MLIRTKSGNFRADNAVMLLDFLGVKQVAGAQKVKADVELIASVPFVLSAEGEGKKEDGILFTFSTFDLDRCGERIDPAGWMLDNYLKNPVVQWAHCFDVPAIGRTEKMFADEKGLHGLVVFNNKDFDPFGWAVGERVRRGILRAMSVGFRVLEVEIPSKKDSEDGTALIFRKQELLESSVCNVPANPFALAKSVDNVQPDTKQGLVSPSFWGNIINSF